MFGVINYETQSFWQSLADNLSRQRPYAGRTVTVVRGRKHKGQRGTVVWHGIDRYEDAFRYANEASQHYITMAGRYGYVTKVRFDDGEIAWIKAKHLACDYPYAHWSVALSDAVTA